MSLLVFFSFPLESFIIFFNSISAGLSRLFRTFSTSLISSRAPFGPHPLLSKNLKTSYAAITPLMVP